MTERRQANADPISALLDPPSVVVALLLTLTLLHIGLDLAPTARERAVWRFVELSPMRLHFAIENGRLASGVAARLVGHMLFHINTAHLLINLAGTYFAGAYVCRVLEERVSARPSDSRVAFLALFLLSGMAAGMAFVTANPKAWFGMMGASGAAAGLWGAAVFAYIADAETRRLRAFAKMAAVSLFLLATGIALDLSPVSKWLFGSVSAWQAHVGGYMFGLLTFPLFLHLAGATKAVSSSAEDGL